MKIRFLLAAFFAVLIAVADAAQARTRGVMMLVSLVRGERAIESVHRPMEITAFASGRHTLRPYRPLIDRDVFNTTEPRNMGSPHLAYNTRDVPMHLRSQLPAGLKFLAEMDSDNGYVQWPAADAFRKYCDYNLPLAFDAIQHSYGADLKRYVAANAPREQIDDVVQEVWARLAKSQGTGTCPRNHNNHAAWLNVVAHNVIAESFQKAALRERTEAVYEDYGYVAFAPTPADQYAYTQLKRCLMKQPFAARDIRVQAALLRLAQESPKAIADVLGRSKSTVQSWEPSTQAALLRCLGRERQDFITDLAH
jgi:DNA-directed RNA polymerase specialized sigma24 family protein